MKAIRGLVILGILLLLWAAGLWVFVDRVVNSTPAIEPENPADAIVVLTGASDQRLQEGMRLLERRKGERMLISGVNPQVTSAELLNVTQGSRRLHECCVEIDYKAEDTVGNAREIAIWADERGYETLIVVTSDYHMPRTLLELKADMPGITMIPYAVATPDLDARKWWKSPRVTRILVLEYCKYLVILGRDAVGSLWHGFRGEKADNGTAGVTGG